MTVQGGVVRDSAGHPTLVFAGTVVATMAVFRVLDIGIARLARIPSDSYTQAFFLDDLALRAWRLASMRVPWWLAVVAVALLLLAFTTDQRRVEERRPAVDVSSVDIAGRAKQDTQRFEISLLNGPYQGSRSISVLHSIAYARFL